MFHISMIHVFTVHAFMVSLVVKHPAVCLPIWFCVTSEARI